MALALSRLRMLVDAAIIRAERSVAVAHTTELWLCSIGASLERRTPSKRSIGKAQTNEVSVLRNIILPEKSYTQNQHGGRITF